MECKHKNINKAEILKSTETGAEYRICPDCGKLTEYCKHEYVFRGVRDKDTNEVKDRFYECYKCGKRDDVDIAVRNVQRIGELSYELAMLKEEKE